ncbi:MAG: queuosine precursor transporter [Aridibacter famidurans]|nr:queuosine precursor transporter [Aridibacter famidurans]
MSDPIQLNDRLSTENTPRYFDIVAGLFVGIYLISQISSAKLVSVGPFVFPGAIVIFPLSYIFGDILTEVYGYARTRRVIWVGFVSAALLAVVLLIVQYLPPAPNWTLQTEFEALLGIVPRVIAGSLMAYWAGEFVNSYIMAKAKVWTGGRMLWTRTIGSTLVGQFVDSVVFGVVAFAGIVPWTVIFTLAGSIYLFKVLYEILFTPVTYFVVGRLKKAEGVDVFDRSTDFNPFKL